jgi:FlhB HrpN YscU SpaS Family
MAEYLVRHRRRHLGDDDLRCADGVEPADHVPRVARQILSDPDRRAGADGAREDARARSRRGVGRAAAHSLRGRVRRQYLAASHCLHDRPDHAENVADLAAGRHGAPVLASGAGELRQGACQALRGRRRHGLGVVAGAAEARRHRHRRSGDDSAVPAHHRTKTSRNGRRGPHRDRRSRLFLPVWFERQKMSPQEVKEEFRQAEGDPAVKCKLRQLRTARMRKRVMACPRPRWSSPTRPITRSRCATSAA